MANHYRHSSDLLERLKNNLLLLLNACTLTPCMESKWMLAVSGGADSVALLMLTSKIAKDWGVPLVVANVNHQLRKESVEEGEYVKKLAHSLGYECLLLKWDRAYLTSSNLQAKARQARYQLLTNAAADYNCSCIFTAHHQGDIVENLLIRNARKSGILGLSSNHIQYFYNTPIIRPLYNFTKSELQDVLNKANIGWMEDPSNCNNKYQRNKIRLHIQKHHIAKLLSAIQKNIDLISHKFNQQLITFFAESVAFYKYGFVIIARDALVPQHHEILYYVFNLILTSIGGREEFRRGESMKRFFDALYQQKYFHKTLGGCNIICNNEQILIYREFGKFPPAPLIISNHTQRIHWDNRFIIELLDKKTEFLPNNNTLYTSALTAACYKPVQKDLYLTELKMLAPQHWHKILLTLPAIYVTDKSHGDLKNHQIQGMQNCIALPHLLYYDSVINNRESQGFRISFRSKFLSRFIHFIGNIGYEE